MRTLRLVALYPEHLNLNGDVANREVLGVYLRWLGCDIEYIDLGIGDAASISALTPDFVMIGHGSIAAWNQISAEFRELKPTLEKWLNLDVPMLAVSTGRDALLEAGPTAPQHVPSLSIVARTYGSSEARSEFCIATHPEIAAGSEILGYLNSAVDSPPLEKFGSLVMTSLHGPVLSRNLDWLHELANSLIERAGGEQIGLSDALSVPEIPKFQRLVEMIRELELGLARE